MVRHNKKYTIITTILILLFLINTVSFAGIVDAHSQDVLNETIKEGISNIEPEIKFSIENFDKFKNKDTNEMLNEILYYSGDKSPILSGYEKLLFQKINISYNPNNEVVTITPSYNTTLEEQRIVKDKIKDFTDLRKTNDIFNFVHNIEESDDFLYSSDNRWNGQTAYGVLIEKVGVCGGFAMLTSDLLTQADIDNEVILGTHIDKNGEIEAHAWNRIYMNDKTFDMDAMNNYEFVENVTKERDITNIDNLGLGNVLIENYLPKDLLNTNLLNEKINKNINVINSFPPLKFGNIEINKEKENIDIEITNLNEIDGFYKNYVKNSISLNEETAFILLSDEGYMKIVKLTMKEEDLKEVLNSNGGVSVRYFREVEYRKINDEELKNKLIELFEKKLINKKISSFNQLVDFIDKDFEEEKVIELDREQIKEEDNNTTNLNSNVEEEENIEISYLLKDNLSNEEFLIELIKDRKMNIINNINEEKLAKLMASKENIRKDLKENEKLLNFYNVLSDDVIFNFDTPPIVKNGRTIVPIRAISEGFNAKVSWNNETQTVTILKGDIIIELPISKKTAKINGEIFNLDREAELINSRTYVPLRFVSEALNLKVDWNQSTETVIISK